MQEMRKTLQFALDKYPERVELTALDELVLESARQNDRRPAYVKLAVPDEIVKALKGSKDAERDIVLLVVVPREVLQRSESRIVLPGEVL